MRHPKPRTLIPTIRLAFRGLLKRFIGNYITLVAFRGSYPYYSTRVTVTFCNYCMSNTLNLKKYELYAWQPPWLPSLTQRYIHPITSVFVTNAMWFQDNNVDNNNCCCYQSRVTSRPYPIAQYAGIEIRVNWCYLYRISSYIFLKPKLNEGFLAN